jgi:hypothetical protein
MKFKNEIYPSELALTSDNKNAQEINYLDLELKIKNSKICYTLYDKRNFFNFPIVNFPNLSGNIPTAQSYSVFMSQLVRYARNCQKLTDFKSNVLKLVGRLLGQHFKLSGLKRVYLKFIHKYANLLRKFDGFTWSWDII